MGLVIGIGPEGACLLAPGGSAGLKRYSPDAAGHHALALDLTRQKQKCCHLLAWETREDYRVENIPKLPAADCRALALRHLEKHWPGSIFRSWYRNKGPLGDQLVMAALSRAEFLSPWLAVLQEVNVPVAGIYGPAGVIPGLLAMAGVLPPKFLALYPLAGRLCQAWVVNGKVQYAREGQAYGADLPGTCREEAGRVLAHLRADKALGADELVPVFVLSPTVLASAMRASCGKLPGAMVGVLPLSDLAALVGMGGLTEVEGCDSLLLACLTIKPPGQQFASESLLRPYRQQRLWQAVGGVAWGLACMGLLAVGGLQYRQGDLSEARAREVARATQLEQRLGDEEAALGPLPVPLAEMDQIAARRDALASGNRVVARLWFEAQSSGRRVPGIEVESARWQAGGALRLAGTVAVDSPRRAAAAFERYTQGLRNLGEVSVHQGPTDVGTGDQWSLGSNSGGVSAYRFELTVSAKEAR